MKQRIKYIQRFEHFGFPQLAVPRPIVEIGNYSVRNFLNFQKNRNYKLRRTSLGTKPSPSGDRTKRQSSR